MVIGLEMSKGYVLSFPCLWVGKLYAQVQSESKVTGLVLAPTCRTARSWTCPTRRKTVACLSAFPCVASQHATFTSQRLKENYHQ